MPADVITLNANAKELDKILSGGKIEKVYQPETDEITLSIKAQGREHILVISASPAHPRIHITTKKKENALNAPAFCMLLRKYLTGAIISCVNIHNCDRIVKIAVDARNELKDCTRYFLLIELMGRYSNIILTTDEYVIIDAIRRIHLDQSTTRYILPNLTYSVPPQTKIRLDDKENLMRFFDENKELSPSILMQNISGISKETAQELASKNDAFSELLAFYNINENERYCPCIVKNGDVVKDYFILPYQTVTGKIQTFNSLNVCLDYYYSIYDNAERKKTHTKNINQLLKRLQTKTENRIADNLQKISESQTCEQIKQKGELILSYIYMIKRGDAELNCFDYFNNINTKILLDTQLNPSQNAQLYYKKYAKLKRAKEFALEQLDRLYKQQEYLNNVEVSISNCETKQEFEEIKEELVALSGIKNTTNNQKRKQKQSAPIHIVIDGYDVYIGKNNIQNVEVTFKIGENNDTWLHTKNYHGSHVIIKGTPTIEVIAKAASIAAYFSGGRSSDKVEVDYTLRKFVKKIPASFVGLVTYTNNKTIFAKPRDALNYGLKVI